MRITHQLKPIYTSKSKILILGTMPSIKSHELKFYYANPTNRFFKILENLFNVNLVTVEEKINFLKTNHIALWDTIKECDIEASKDSTIKNIIVNDIPSLLKETSIKAIFCTGNKAYEIYQKKLADRIELPVYLLPSPSAANAKENLDSLTNKYSIIKKYL